MPRQTPTRGFTQPIFIAKHGRRGRRVRSVSLGIAVLASAWLIAVAFGGFGFLVSRAGETTAVTMPAWSVRCPGTFRAGPWRLSDDRSLGGRGDHWLLYIYADAVLSHEQRRRECAFAYRWVRQLTLHSAHAKGPLQWSCRQFSGSDLLVKQSLCRTVDAERHRAFAWYPDVGTRDRGTSQVVAATGPGIVTTPRWLNSVRVTEYWPAPERWFRGRRVRASGLPGRHRIDWLYSALGLSREEDGVALDGRRYHVQALGHGGWVTRRGNLVAVDSDAVYWRAGGFWRNRPGAVTFPLERGGWSNGVGVRYVPLRGARFAPGPSLPLRYYHSLAVDPRLIPRGSHVYIPAYRAVAGGWFSAQDTGGPIRGAHVDVFRPAPVSPDGGRDLRNQRVYVVPPGYPIPGGAPPG